MDNQCRRFKYLRHRCLSWPGKWESFGKAFRILGLDERKGRWVVKQDFQGYFWVNVTSFFLHFSPVSSTESCSF